MNKEGKVFLPYLNEWRFPGYDLSGLLQMSLFPFLESIIITLITYILSLSLLSPYLIFLFYVMAMVFQEKCPVFARSAAASAASSATPSATSSASATPYPTAQPAMPTPYPSGASGPTPYPTSATPYPNAGQGMGYK